MLQGELIEVRSIESAVAALRNTTDLKSANSKPVLEEPGTENRPHLLLATRLRPATGPEKLWELCALHNSLLCCISWDSIRPISSRIRNIKTHSSGMLSCTNCADRGSKRGHPCVAAPPSMHGTELLSMQDVAPALFAASRLKHEHSLWHRPLHAPRRDKCRAADSQAKSTLWKNCLCAQVSLLKLHYRTSKSLLEAQAPDTMLHLRALDFGLR